MNDSLMFGILIGIVLAVMLLIYLSYQLSQRVSEIQRQVPDQQYVNQLSHRLQQVDESNRKSFERLSGALGQLSRATEQMIDIGSEISSLEDLLKPPTLRGGLGETMLYQLLSETIPGHYQTQYKFQSGAVVDAVIKLGRNLVPVDSKFPLEQFRRLQDAQSPEEQLAQKKKFNRVVKGHIDDITSKYIQPDERTYNFALMYIPAENVYYETIIRDQQENDLYPYALEKRVIPVSPHTFFAYLQVIIRGLRGMKIEERAQSILEYINQLKGDQIRLREDFEVLGTHIKNTSQKYVQTERRLNRLEDKLALSRSLESISLDDS